MGSKYTLADLHAMKSEHYAKSTTTSFTVTLSGGGHWGWDSIGYVDQIQGVKIASSEGTYTYGAIEHHADGPLPEALCGNCRRDWHEAPLTEVVARMWDSANFDEDYDLEKDDSRVLCPGSDCCGPAVKPASLTYSTAPTGTILSGLLTWPEPEPYPNPVLKMYDGMWELINPSYGYVEHFTPSPWEYKGKGDDLVQAILDEAINLAVECKTWHPEDTYKPYPQAASEAVPKAIEMEHKAPVAPGFDFSHINDVPGYYQPPKKGKKK